MRKNILIIIGLAILLGLIYWFSDKPPYHTSFNFSPITPLPVSQSSTTLDFSPTTSPGEEAFKVNPKDLTASKSIESNLENRDYVLLDDNGKGGTKQVTVQLKNGVGQYPYTPSKLESDVGEVELYKVDYTASGDLNNDNQEDAAAIVYSYLAVGNGYAPFLVTFINNNNQLAQVSEIDLGGRDEINSLSIEEGQVIVDMMIHGPNDGACCASVHKVYTYTLDQLIKDNEAIQKDAQGQYLL